jgi:hypothetical protein
MTLQDVQTFLAITERAQLRGLVSVDEMPPVFNAMQAGRKWLSEMQQQPPAPVAQAATDQPAQAATKEKANGNP